MYPNLFYAIRDWFGVEINAFKIFYTFGIFIALSFIAAAVVLTKELKRKEKQGKLFPTEEIITVGKPASIFDLIVNGLIGFAFGYKLLGAFLASRSASIDLQEYIFSADGSIIGGLILAALLVYLKYQEKNKLKLDKPEDRVVRIWPHDRVGDIVIIALISGIIGAKFFDNLENWDRFIKNPLGNLLSPSGLTFYGGLIFGTLSVCFYLYKKKISLWHVADAIAPALMLAYAVGRIGCQVAGDGDWGVYNSAYVSDAPGHVVVAKPGDFENALNKNSTYFLYGKVTNTDASTTPVTDRVYPDLAHVSHASFKGPAFLPSWLFAYTYPHNVNEDGILLPNCDGKYCRALPQPVFPTPMYETLMGTILFLILWFLRTSVKKKGVIMSIYLIMNGLERFFIEKIRVNTTYSIYGFHPTQAEIISAVLVIVGIIMLVYCQNRKTPQQTQLKT
ncbi:MAG: hypothetical protein NVS3B19_13030 [Ginsengibacter sp.]